MYMDAKNKNEGGNRVGILGGGFGVGREDPRRGPRERSGSQGKDSTAAQIGSRKSPYIRVTVEFNSRIETQGRRASSSRSPSSSELSVGVFGVGHGIGE
jgi:hypothetical protein